jgi:hypothetical protein
MQVIGKWWHRWKATGKAVNNEIQQPLSCCSIWIVLALVRSISLHLSLAGPIGISPPPVRLALAIITTRFQAFNEAGVIGSHDGFLNLVRELLPVPVMVNPTGRVIAKRIWTDWFDRAHDVVATPSGRKPLTEGLIDNCCCPNQPWFVLHSLW